MHICYVLLFTTFGMHQYTADLANRFVRLGNRVHLVTTAHYPAHRCLSAVTAHVPLNTRTTGFSAEGLHLASVREEALALFRRCGILILPYMGATQSALIPAAYFFHKPVIAAPSGALDEYVVDGETGWVIEPEHPPSLARCLFGALSDVSRLARMGRAGRAWYDDNRRAEEVELRRMYERVAQGG